MPSISPVYTTFLDHRGRDITPWAQRWTSTLDQFVLLPANQQIDYVFHFEENLHKTAESLVPIFRSQYTICQVCPQILHQFKNLVSSYFRAHIDHYARYSSLKFYENVDRPFNLEVHNLDKQIYLKIL